VGFVGSNVKWMMESRVKNFLKENPDYYAGKADFMGTGFGKGDKGGALVEALSLLSANNPDIAVFSQALADHMKSDAYGYQGANEHVMEKKGVFGMEGNKPWVTGWKSLLPLSPDMKQAAIAKQNALDGFRAQVQYIESMSKWSTLSKATQDLAKVMSDPAIQESQKNAIAMSKEYIRNALGDNPSRFGRALDQGVSAVGEFVGVGPSVFSDMVRGVKGGINTVFFGLNPTFLGANALQGMAASPMMVNFLRDRGFDVAALDKTGLAAYSEATMAGLNQILQPNKDAWTTSMFKYGEEHGISASQIFEHSTDIRKGVQHYATTALEAGSGTVEAVPRMTMYVMFSNLLKENGYENHPDVFKVARELTDKAMADYRPHEGQRINRAFGPLAPLLGNLSTFAGNANSLIAQMATEASKPGKGRAMAAMVIAGLVVHGLMGGSGFQEADAIVETLSTAMGKPTTLSNEILKATNEWGNAGDILATGFGSMLGLDFHNVLGRSSALPSQIGGGGAGAAWDTATSLWTAAVSPSEMNVKRAAYNVSPKLLKGAEDITWFSQGDMAMNKKEGRSTEGLFRRTPFDTKARAFGATSLNEFKMKEQSRQQMVEDIHLKKRQDNVLNKLKDLRVSSSGLTEEAITKGLDRFMEAEGDPKRFIADLTKNEIGINTTAVQRYLLAKSKSGNISATRALQRLSEKSYGESE
jgi:hypothetical protein